jgi:hypothetical protein
MRLHKARFQAAVCLTAVAIAAAAQGNRELSDAEYTSLALSAAPKAVAKDAAVVRADKDGRMRTLRQGKNGFSCMILGGNKMCADANSMEFFDAVMKHQAPPDKLGLAYMLAGDDGASNTDPYAATKTADNHWIVTGPHIMVVGPQSKTLGLTEAPDADPSRPYMMWAGTPYEHAMIPVASSR